jgi:uncharacterized protein
VTQLLSGIDRCRRECDYFGVCGGGSPANKVFEHGTFASTQTLKCSLQTQALVDVVLAELETSHPYRSETL